MKRTAGGIVLLLPLWGLAQEVPNNNTDVYSMDLEQLAQLPVSTPTRTAESLQHSAGTVLVYTRDEIRERGYRNLGELLQALPGVLVQGNANADSSNLVSWRGLSGNDKFIIMQNGVRIGTPADEPLAITDNFPLYYVRRVEIVYGPSSALYGADAMAGVINLITDTDDSGNSAKVSVAKGDVGYDRANAEAHYSSSWLRLSAGGQRQGANNTDLATAYPNTFVLGNLSSGGSVLVPAAERNPYSGNVDTWQAYVDALLGDHVQLGFFGNHINQPSSVSDLPSFTNYGDSLSSGTQTFYGRYKFAPNDQLNGEFTLNYAHYELTPGSTFDNGLTLYQNLFKYAESQRKQAELVVNYTWASNQTLTTGAEVEHIQAIPKTADLTQPYVTGESPVQQGLYYAGTNSTLPVQIYNIAYHSWGAFMQQQSAWTDSLRSVAGVRFDGYSSFGNTTNPRVALIFEPTTTQKFSLSYGKAFLAPSPYFTYELFGSFSGKQNAQGLYTANSLQIPNPNLGPERLQTWQLDYQWRPSTDWQFCATGYRNRLDGFITSMQSQPPDSTFVPGGFITATTINANDGELDVTGLDLRLDHTQDFNGTRLKSWASYSYITGQQDSPSGQLPIPYTAKNSGKLGSTLNWRDYYSLSPSLTAASPSASGHLGKQAPGYAVANIYARRDNLLPHLNLFARVDDLFDAGWYNSGAGGSTTLAASPQNRRTYTLGLELDL